MTPQTYRNLGQDYLRKALNNAGYDNTQESILGNLFILGATILDKLEKIEKLLEKEK